MRRDEARVHALKAALELRTGASTPAAIVAQAKEFETYIDPDGKDTAQAPLPAGQAPQETASAGRSTRK